MHYKSLVLIVIALMTIGLFNPEAEAKKMRKTKEELNSMTCKQMENYLIREGMAAMMDCAQKLGVKSLSEGKERMFCILKCIGIEEGILNEDGSISKERIVKFMDEQVPDKFHPLIYPLLNDCVFNQNIEVDPTDKLCKSYKPIMTCAMAKIGPIDPTNVCDSFAEEFGRGK